MRVPLQVGRCNAGQALASSFAVLKSAAASASLGARCPYTLSAGPHQPGAAPVPLPASQEGG